jgi:5'-phosphate synthase pdxT subunit
MAVVGVLGLQGDFREHLKTLERLGAHPIVVRTPAELEQVEALIIPGGESTTIGKLAHRFGLLEALSQRIEGGMPTYGTCAGMIFLAGDIANGVLTNGDQPILRALDVVVERNAFGRQNDSFEADLDVVGFDRPFPAVFIRAPWVVKVGEGVEVLATIGDHPVMVRQGHILATSFHPELTGDDRIHRMFIESIVRS